jgi:hypothetical protein
MPDYNRQTTAYWWITVLLGVAVLAHTLPTLSALPLLTLAEVFAGAAIAMLAGFFPFRVPRSKNSFTAGEIAIFLLLLCTARQPRRSPLPAKPSSARGAPPSAGRAASSAPRRRASPCSAPARCCTRR